MKSILFATTALVASAGFASADITFEGSAQAGVGSQDGADAIVYSAAELSVAMTGTSDAGIEFGANMSVTRGREFDIDDLEDDDDADGTVGFDGAFLSFAGSTLTFERNGIDDLYEDDNGDALGSESHDIKFEYALNNVTAALTYEGGDTDTDLTNDQGQTEFSYQFGYTFSGITGTVTGNDVTEALKFGVAYAGPNYNAGIEYDQAGEGNDAITTVSGDYTFNGITLSAEFDTEDDYDVGVAYAMNGLSLGVNYDEEEVFDLNGSYDLGGGLSLVGGYETEGDTNSGGDSYGFGVAMTF